MSGGDSGEGETVTGSLGPKALGIYRFGRRAGDRSCACIQKGHGVADSVL